MELKLLTKKIIKEKILNSKIIILSASPLSNYKNFKEFVNEFFPVGLGNSSNLLGKYIFDHVHCFRDIKFSFNKKF